MQTRKLVILWRKGQGGKAAKFSDSALDMIAPRRHGDTESSKRLVNADITLIFVAIASAICRIVSVQFAFISGWQTEVSSLCPPRLRGKESPAIKSRRRRE